VNKVNRIWFALPFIAACNSGVTAKQVKTAPAPVPTASATIVTTKQAVTPPPVKEALPCSGLLETDEKITAKLGAITAGKHSSGGVPINLQIKISGMPENTKVFSVAFLSDNRIFKQDTLEWKGPGNYIVKGHLWSLYFNFICRGIPDPPHSSPRFQSCYDYDEIHRQYIFLDVILTAHSEAGSCPLTEETLHLAIEKWQYRALWNASASKL
jgi:hypothetical protein